jgi:hypothetical protein
MRSFIAALAMAALCAATIPDVEILTPSAGTLLDAHFVTSVPVTVACPHPPFALHLHLADAPLAVAACPFAADLSALGPGLFYLRALLLLNGSVVARDAVYFELRFLGPPPPPSERPPPPPLAAPVDPFEGFDEPADVLRDYVQSPFFFEMFDPPPQVSSPRAKRSFR